VLGNKIAKQESNTSIAYRGNPQFFYEVVQYWVAFELVQVFHKYGLNPKFKATSRNGQKTCIAWFSF